MTSSEIDFLKVHIDEKFKTLEKRQDDILKDIDAIKKEIPLIARDKAEEMIARTAFIKPFEKLTVGISLFLVLLTAFGSYGKLTSMIDRFERLEKKIDESHVVESSEWIQENKKPLSLKITELDKKMNNMELKIQLIQNTAFSR